MASIRRVIILSVTLVTLVLIACGSDATLPVSAPTILSTPVALISREEAIRIAITQMTEGDLNPGSRGPLMNPRDITARFMPLEEYEGLVGGTGEWGGGGYSGSGNIWVV
jgi:hypothetical protein